MSMVWGLPLEWLGQLKELFLAWEDQVRAIADYATFVAVIWTMIKLARSSQTVAIVAVNADTGERRPVASLPRYQVCRSEVLGLLRLEAGGSQLDTSHFRWDDNFRREVHIRLPKHSFDLLRDRAECLN